jgi:hypothetical protein
MALGEQVMQAIKLMGALALVFGLATPVLAVDTSVVGTWQPDNKESDYKATLCGDDLQRLCLQLVALRYGADKPDYRPYLGKNIVDGAKPKGDRSWKGQLNYFGQTADATFTLKGPNELEMNGCAYLVVCKTIRLNRIK